MLETNTNIGYITQIIGPVVDAVFPSGELPKIYSAINIEFEGKTIVCEVQQWHDSESDDIIIKKALKIVSIEDYSRGIRFFALRPWMSFQDDPDYLHSLNAAHVIVTSEPTKPMLKYYNTCLKAIKGEMSKGPLKRKGIWASLDEVNENIEDVKDNLEDDLEEVRDNLEDDLEDDLEGSIYCSQFT